jgi:hypothetical protein
VYVELVLLDSPIKEGDRYLVALVNFKGEFLKVYLTGPNGRRLVDYLTVDPRKLNELKCALVYLVGSDSMEQLLGIVSKYGEPKFVNINLGKNTAMFSGFSGELDNSPYGSWNLNLFRGTFQLKCSYDRRIPLKSIEDPYILLKVHSSGSKLDVLVREAAENMIVLT